MPTVFLDARKLSDGGIGVYIKNLIDGLVPQLDTLPFSLTAILDSKRLKHSAVRQVLEIKHPKFHCVQDRARPYSFDEMVFFPLRLRKLMQQGDVFHAPHYTLPLLLNCKRLVTIHDIIHLTYPDSWRHKIIGGAFLKLAARRAHQVLTVSSHSKTQLELHLPSARGKVLVVPNGLNKNIAPLPVAQAKQRIRLFYLGEQFGLFVGSGRPHKGLSNLLKAWNLLQYSLQQRQLPAIKLALVGVRGTERLQQEIASLGLEKLVVFVGEQSAETLAALYAAATVTVISSREEGFGLVALESIACGCPLVSTPLASVQEICGTAATYAEDFSAESLFRAVQRSLQQDEASKAQQQKAGFIRAQFFSVERACAETAAVYQSLLGTKAERIVGEPLRRQANE